MTIERRAFLSGLVAGGATGVASAKPSGPNITFSDDSGAGGLFFSTSPTMLASPSESEPPPVEEQLRQWYFQDHPSDGDAASALQKILERVVCQHVPADVDTMSDVRRKVAANKTSHVERRYSDAAAVPLFGREPLLYAVLKHEDVSAAEWPERVRDLAAAQTIKLRTLYPNAALPRVRVELFMSIVYITVWTVEIVKAGPAV